MIVRTAVLEGTVPEADRPAFDARMREAVLPAIARYPGLRRATLRRAAGQEPGAPPVYMLFELWFDDLAAMEAALASPVRQEVRARIAEAMGPFQGRVYHLVSEEAGEVGPAA